MFPFGKDDDQPVEPTEPTPAQKPEPTPEPTPTPGNDDVVTPANVTDVPTLQRLCNKVFVPFDSGDHAATLNRIAGRLMTVRLSGETDDQLLLRLRNRVFSATV